MFYSHTVSAQDDDDIIRASVDALYRDGANVRGDAHMLKASMPRECVNMSILGHLVKLYKAY